MPRSLTDDANNYGLIPCQNSYVIPPNDYMLPSNIPSILNMTCSMANLLALETNTYSNFNVPEAALWMIHLLMDFQICGQETSVELPII